MAQKEYYKILEVDRHATDEDIKKSYRRLAMKYHPDHAGGDKAAEARFKEISEAYAVLSDREKRKEYDTFGSEGFHQRFSREDIFRNFDFSGILREFGFGSPGGKGSQGRFSFGGDSFFNGAGAQRAPRPVRGEDLVYELPLTLEEIFEGTNKTITLGRTGDSEKVAVKIPRGLIDGKKIRLEGKGHPGKFGGPPGDVYIKSRVIPHPVFEVDLYDLTIAREIRLSEALLGTSLPIPTLDGKEVSLKIPPGTGHKTRMRLAGQGLPQTKGSDRGDLFVQIHVRMPRQLDPEQKSLIEKLGQTGL